MHPLSPLYKRRARSYVLVSLVCVSSAGQTAWSEENPDKQLTFQDIFRATELRLVQGTASGFSVEDIAGISGTTIALKMRLPSQIDEGAGSNATRRFLMFRGLPDELTLTSGFRTRNVWIVAVSDVGKLKLNVPPNYQGKIPVEVLLYQGETKTPESRTISVDIIPPGQTVAEAPADAAPKQKAPGKPARTQSPGALGALQAGDRVAESGRDPSPERQRRVCPRAF